MKEKRKRAIRSFVREKYFFKVLDDHEVFQLAIYFQKQKKKYLVKFLQCLERQIEGGQSNLKSSGLHQERLKLWKQYIYFEKLVEGCLHQVKIRNKKKK